MSTTEAVATVRSLPVAEPVVVGAETLRGWPLPDPATDKESRGRVLVVGGGTETPGAVLLAGEAGLPAGAGQAQVAGAAGGGPSPPPGGPGCRAPGGPAGRESTTLKPTHAHIS